MMQTKYKRFDQAGVILLETLIAILIFSIGILALVGVQAVMVSNTSDAKYRSEANYIVQRRIAEIWGAGPVNQAAMAEVDTDISTLLPGGKRNTVQVSFHTNDDGIIDSREFMVLVTWQPLGDPGNVVVHQHMAIARVSTEGS